MRGRVSLDANDRRDLFWLFLRELGVMEIDVASMYKVSPRHVRSRVALARDLREHLHFPRFRLIGQQGELTPTSECTHGPLPRSGKIDPDNVVCIRCNQSNCEHWRQMAINPEIMRMLNPGAPIPGGMAGGLGKRPRTSPSRGKRSSTGSGTNS